MSRELALSILIDNVAYPLRLDRWRSLGTWSLAGPVSVELGDEKVDLEFGLRLDPPSDALVLELRANKSPPAAHSLALRIDLVADDDDVFVSGVGELGDRASVAGRIAVVFAKEHPLGFATTGTAIGVTTSLPEPGESGLRLSLTSPPVELQGAVSPTNLAVVVGETPLGVWRTLYGLTGTKTLRVQGKVTGTTERAQVFGRDAQGSPQLRAFAEPNNVFALEAPATVVEWYAAVDVARASALASYVPGTPQDLVLDVSPGGELAVIIRDADTRQPLTARLLVKGVDGTVDPSFGPDYRASGAGPLIDTLHGVVKTPLPAGHYRVGATKGLEWSVDMRTVTIEPGHTTELVLEPRHVVPTPGVVGCDLHVHARPSFDSPVSMEDRVLSLVSAGIDFAIPSEHNIVGDYGPAIKTYDLAREFSSVTGVEVTTVGPSIGHFNVYPYPADQKVPPHRGVHLGAIVRAVRAGDPNRQRVLQVNHPRLQRGIGYFHIIGLDPRHPRLRRGQLEFDAIEVFNGSLPMCGSGRPPGSMSARFASWWEARQ